MSTYRIGHRPLALQRLRLLRRTLPGVIHLEGGIARVMTTEVADPAALEAASSCPMGAIAVFDAVSGAQVA